MKLLTFDPLGTLGVGFLIGFLIILVAFLIAYFSGKELPTIKKSLLIIFALLILIYTPPIKGVSKIWLVVSLMVLAMLINNILYSIYSITNMIYNKHFNKNEFRKISTIIYLAFFLIAVGLIAAAQPNVILSAYVLIKQLILVSIGIYLALRLFYHKPTHYEENHR